MTRAKNKKAASDICPKISNKISTRRTLSVVETTRQNVLETFFLPSNCKKLPLVATEATSSSLAGFSPIKVNPSVVFTPTKSPKVFNNKPVNKLVFSSIALTSGASSTFSSKKMLPASTIVTLNPFVVPNEILDKISIVSSSTSFKIGQDQPPAVLPNVVSFSRLSPVLEAKQSPPVGLPIETKSSPPLVSGATSGGAWKTIASLTSTLVLGVTFKIKLAYIKAVFQSVHGLLGAKSVLKDNVKLFCVKFASQTSLDAAFLVEFTSSICLATLKIAKSLVVSESEFSSIAVALRDVSLGVSAANIKTALSVFGMITHVMLKSADIWQYVVVHFEKLDSAMSALNHWSVLVDKNCVRILLLVNQNETILFHDRFKTKLVNLSSGCTAFEISNMISQVGGQSCFIFWSPDFGCHFHFALVMFGFQADLDFAVANTSYLTVDCKVASFSFPKAPKVFKPYFVGSLSYAKASVPLVMSEFFPLVASAPSVAVVNSAVGSRLDSLEKQISDLAALVKSIVESVGSLVVLVSCLLNDNAVKTIQSEKNFLSMKYASNNFANLLVGVSKDIACLRFEVDFGGMDYDDM
ncbi:hypothetical protein G9A89_013623 [Geosiphon pyriformis]|nr:hypothetical protein G9A89_013623 [Geosiphon pyriformis]